MSKNKSICIIGAGAAGFFAAIHSKKHHPDADVYILEKNNALLSKVRISGGGRCNVTHACFDPKELVKNYPRGSKELLGPFYTFSPKDTIEWFKERGVELKKEGDGRMFPTTDSSQTIIDCFLKEAKTLGIEIWKKEKIEKIEKKENLFFIYTPNKRYQADKLILATGSSPQGHVWAQKFGHTLMDPIPSLFTFNMPHSPLKDLSGITLKEVEVKIKNTAHLQKGPLLITHFGLSGPAILKLSAWAAKDLYEKKYDFEIEINWLPSFSIEKIKKQLLKLKEENKSNKSKLLVNENPFSFPKNFWKYLLNTLSLISKKTSEISSKQILVLAEKLIKDTYPIQGKTTFKEEFVTCGGISLKEVNFKTMESKVCPNLFFAGEVLDIDGITGGFNFQNAWTTGYIAGSGPI